MSMSTGRWSELSAQHEVRYTGVERFFVIKMSKTLWVAEGLYGLVVWVSIPKIRFQRSDRSPHRHSPVGVFVVRC